MGEFGDGGEQQSKANEREEKQSAVERALALVDAHEVEHVKVPSSGTTFEVQAFQKPPVTTSQSWSG